MASASPAVAVRNNPRRLRRDGASDTIDWLSLKNIRTIFSRQDCVLLKSRARIFFAPSCVKQTPHAYHDSHEGPQAEVRNRASEQGKISG